MKRSYLIDPSANEFDTTILIGFEDDNCDGSLLLCRFHKLHPLLSKRKKQMSRKLLRGVMNELKNNGLERRQTGGSSGYT